MVNVASTAQTLSDDYAGASDWIGLATVNGQRPVRTACRGADRRSGYRRVQTQPGDPIGGGVNVGPRSRSVRPRASTPS